MTQRPSICWFRHDLRVDDNPALLEAQRDNKPVVPVFIWAPDEEGTHPPGAASRWWLHHSLEQLNADLQELGSQLVIRRGNSFEQLEQLIHETRADAVFWNRRYELSAIERDKCIKSILRERGLRAESFNASLLWEPWEVATKQGKPYQVFTPFWKACRALDTPASPQDKPTRIAGPDSWPNSVPLDSLGLKPRLDWADGFKECWNPGSEGAAQQFEHFLKQGVSDYKVQRDFPAEFGTSKLSPHLHFGEISPRRVWHAAMEVLETAADADESSSMETFLAEIGWREFAHHVLYHFPQTANQPLRQNFADFPWQSNRNDLIVWQKGRTGYPIVDAGMRELWSTGWMHNRVRMIVGSFLTKDLLQSWREGANWFWDTLVDADLANNTLGWQWVSGCGADAAPYFRVFNPVSQGEKFDPAGDYVRRWVPELAQLQGRWIHQPWNAPPEVLHEAEVQLDRTYPRPIVDHAEARQAALEAFTSIKSR